MTPPDERSNRPATPRDFEQDLEPELESQEREALLALATHLTEDRPVPRAGLRSEIRSQLLGDDAPLRRSRIAALIFGYATSGALLLAIAAVGLVGVGPFAA